MSIFMYVHVHIHMCIRIYIYIYIYLFIYTHIMGLVCIFATVWVRPVFVFLPTYSKCMYMYRYILTDVYARLAHAYTCALISIRRCLCLCICTCILKHVYASECMQKSCTPIPTPIHVYI